MPYRMRNITKIQEPLYKAIQPGKIVRIVEKCPAIPENWDAEITMHEGSVPRIESNTLGMITEGLFKGHQIENGVWSYSFYRVLINNEIFGIASVHLEEIHQFQ